MEEKLDELQEKCFALLGTLNAIKNQEISLVNDEAGVYRFNKDLHGLMSAGSVFFNASQVDR
jgi:hypothetical protein